MSNWFERLLEASEDEVDEVIASAIDSKDAQGIEDVNHADTAVKDSDVSDDPTKLVYDKLDCYSQDTSIGDENTAGTVDIDNDDTDETVVSGSETKATAESTLTKDELSSLYTEAVSEVINESAEEINAKYKEKIKAAKEWKAKALAKEKAKAKKGVAENASIDDIVQSIFG